jgi:hypothetical protein
VLIGGCLDIPDILGHNTQGGSVNLVKFGIERAELRSRSNSGRSHTTARGHIYMDYCMWPGKIQQFQDLQMSRLSVNRQSRFLDVSRLGMGCSKPLLDMCVAFRHFALRYICYSYDESVACCVINAIHSCHLQTFCVLSRHIPASTEDRRGGNPQSHAKACGLAHF